MDRTAVLRRQESLKLAASDLRFSGLTLTTGGRSPKALLQGISGCCDGGTITAVVGPSGAGKSLLLDVLAGQPPVGCAVGGSIQLDGTPLSPAVMQERACLVLQNDVLLATATVREMVTHSALLRLPADMPREAKLERVEAILQELDLAGCADSLIGDSERGRQRLSGGQRRRTTLAIELVRLPCLLLLDEPLSGLDSEMALSVIQGLSHLTAQGRIVLLSVHQASPTLERKFQQLLVMASGRLVCAGTHSQALECIEQAGLSCPAYESPVDFLVAAVKVPEQQDALVAAFEGLRDGWGVEGCNSGTPHGKLIGSCGTPAVSTGSVGDEEQGRQHSAAGNTKGGDALGKTGAWHVLTHFSATTCLLSKRHMLSALRKPKALAMEVLRKIVVFAFLGLLYLNVSNTLFEGTSNRLSALGIICLTVVASHLHIAVGALHTEVPLLRREQRTHAYPLSAYILARTVAELLFSLPANAIATVSIYYLIGLQPSGTSYLLFFVIFQLTYVATDGLGILLRAVSDDLMPAHYLTDMVAAVLIVSTGFLVYDLPVYMRWLSYLTYAAYAYRAQVLIEFTGLVLDLPAPLTGTVTMLSDDDMALQRTALGGRGDISPVSVGVCCVMIAAQALLFHIACWGVLVLRARKRQL